MNVSKPLKNIITAVMITHIFILNLPVGVFYSFHKLTTVIKGIIPIILFPSPHPYLESGRFSILSEAGGMKTETTLLLLQAGIY